MGAKCHPRYHELSEEQLQGCTDPKKLDQNLTIGGRYFYG